MIQSKKITFFSQLFSETAMCIFKKAYRFTQLYAKSVFSVLAAVIMLFSALPLTAYAEDNTTIDNKTVMLGVSQIKGAQADNVYLGKYKQSSDGKGGYLIEPVKWRVLSNADNKLFLLSDPALEFLPFHEEWLRSADLFWEHCTLRSWLNGYINTTVSYGPIDYSNDNFLDTAFSELEQVAILETTGLSAYNWCRSTSRCGNETTDKIFLLSIGDAANTEYGFPESDICPDPSEGSDLRKPTRTDYIADKNDEYTYDDDGRATYWHLRSVGGYKSRNAVISSNGALIDAGTDIYFPCAVRPAFNLDADSVLFTSAANNSGHIYFGEPSSYGGNDWKVTLRDGNSFKEGTSLNRTSLAAGETLIVTHKALSDISLSYTNVTATLTDANGNLHR
ncbi:MAG: hypothetical protein E7678_03195, partial [Ruminococcaceae bacterium]|nr:hypothetical protein [Oscillospiraceae bacterium]